MQMVSAILRTYLKGVWLVNTLRFYRSERQFPEINRLFEEVCAQKAFFRYKTTNQDSRSIFSFNFSQCFEKQHYVSPY